MRAWNSVASRVRALFSRRRLESEFDEELQTHLGLLIDEHLRRGMSTEEARRTALLKLGGPAQIREEQRDHRSLPWLETALQDLRYALRGCMKAPGFTAVAVATLALGIGANTLIFSIVNTLFFEPLAFRDPGRLVNIWESSVRNPKDLNIVSAPNYLDWKRESHVFENMALFDSAGKGYNLGGGKDPENVPGLRVTASLFTVLGVTPYLGRTFVPEEELKGKDRVVVLSYGLWRRRYAADPAVLGKSVRVDGENYTVIGVMPSRFQFEFYSGRNELWVPIGFDSGDMERSSHSFGACARLKPGVTLARAQAEIAAISRRLSKQYPGATMGSYATLTPLADFGVADLQPAFIALTTAVGFVLLIACVNVANLMLARGAARQQEFAIRRALGAGRGRIVRQVLTESFVLSLLGGAAGLALAFAGTRLFSGVLAALLGGLPMRGIDGVSIDGRVLAYTLLLCWITGALFGLGSAWGIVRGTMNEPLKEGRGRGSTGPGGRLRNVLVAAEIALALVVLAGAGLMLQSMSRLLRVAPGFDPKNVLYMSVSLPQEVLYYSAPVRPGFCRDLTSHAGALPGIVSVSAVSHLPTNSGGAGRAFTIEGRPAPDPENLPGSRYGLICPDYFRTLGIPLIAGREFTPQDTTGAPAVAIISQGLARRYWPKENPIGHRFKIAMLETNAPWLTVVGIAADVRHGLDQQPAGEFFRPYTQAGWPVMTVLARTRSAPLAFAQAIRRALLQIDPDQAAAGVGTLEEALRESIGPRQLPTFLLSAFGLLALSLAAVGISGVVGYSVVQRTQEIGVRVALGAGTRDVLVLVLGRSMAWALAGIAAGLAGSFALTRLLEGMLFEVKPMDPFVLGGVSLVLAVVALLASSVPARRAAKVDPVVALRCN